MDIYSVHQMTTYVTYCLTIEIYTGQTFIIPHATSCGGYNVFDPSVSQSVSQSVRQSISPVFSSPELKAQVSFSDHLSSVVCLSVRLSVRLSVCLSVNFSHFHLLLQNHWANFNQTWHKVFLGEGDSSLFK